MLFSNSQFRLKTSNMPIQVNQRKLLITSDQNVFGSVVVAVFVAAAVDWVSLV